jgi:hypothetical protein
LQPAFREFKQILPTNGVSVLSMGFVDSDTAQITARVRGNSAAVIRDFWFVRAGGKWRLNGEGQARLADYPKVGITPQQLEEAMDQIVGLLPTSGILFITFEAAVIEVTTGRQGGPRYGRGIMFWFQTKNGKWQKTGEGEWVS